MAGKTLAIALAGSVFVVLGCGSSSTDYHDMTTLAQAMEKASAVTSVSCMQTGSNTAHCTGTGVDGKPTTTNVTITSDGSNWELVGLGWTAPSH